MSATYNWAYQPSVTNKYGLTIPAGADNASVSGVVYVALFGNDNTGNGSRQRPYQTINKGYSLCASGGVLVLGAGTYRPNSTINTGVSSVTIVGDGDVKIDISYLGNLFNVSANSPSFLNLEIIGNGAGNLNTTYFVGNPIFTDVVFNGVSHSGANIGNGQDTYTNCIFKNISAIVYIKAPGGAVLYTGVKNCTFYNCNSIQVVNNYYPQIDSCIFYNCNISVNSHLTFFYCRYTLFFQCNFKLSDGVATGGVLYPSVPTSFTYYSSISTLLAGYNTLFSTTSLTGCNVADPLFNNASIGDFSLSFSSPAKNLSYFGTFVGARSIAYQIKVRATESAGTFDFSTNVNLTVADDSITITNTTLNAEIKTVCIVNAQGRQINKIPIYGFNADRNGQYIDSIADLDIVTKATTDTLAYPASYIVEVGAITYNSNVYQVGDRLTTVSGVLSFTTAASGVLREILEAPQRHTVMMRVSDGLGTITAGTALVVGNWYFVTGSVTYNSTVYTNQAFKAINTSAFSGTGTVVLALDSTISFQHYEPGIQPTSNNTGDVRTGSILRGNGDPAYVRGGYNVKEFPINAKFIQLYFLIKVSNLKP